MPETLDRTDTARSDGGFVQLFAEFGGALRRAGLSVGTDDVTAFCSAVAELDPSDILDLYWAGRTTMVTRRDQIPVYDRVFREFFLDESTADPDVRRETIRASSGSEAVLEVPAPDPGSPGAEEEEPRLGLMASGAEVWRHKAFAECSPEELAALRRIIARVRLLPPRRRTRRTVSSDDGARLHLRRMARETMRTHGEPTGLHWRRRRLRRRPLVLLLDVSGSMSDYSRNLLQFAYSARRADGRVEVFCFGTRLTRITPALDRRRADEALDRAARTVFDWDGGTRIGDSIDTFVRRYARRGMSRGAIVVICSDGLDRGEPAVLDGAMDRLARLCHRIVWMNPHKGDDEHYEPTSLGMRVAAPYVDEIWSGHNLADLEAFADRLAELR